jgi:hypothetical protein
MESTQPVTIGAYARHHRKTIAVTAIIVLLAAGWLYQIQASRQLQKSQTNSVASRQKTTSSEATALRNQVAKVVDLPTNETPTVATVTDVKKLQNQAFFAKAQNGDKVLMFAQAKQVILFRPASQKIVQIAPIDVGTAAAAATNP